MSMPALLCVVLTAAVVFSVLNVIGKAKNPLKKSIMTMLSGVGALAAVNLLSSFTAVCIPVSVVSIAVSVVGGIPGVTLILALNAFF
ncbi:MAG: pro-sigmaK processing inhibitor BofA family protein [Lachnospiraceae bacterium]|nr:pro-sigmaK processing inhibitor BofA family protein [Lachnospiraceae bacterium]